MESNETTQSTGFDGVIVHGIISSPALEDSHNGHMFTERDFRMMSQSPAFKVPVLVNHDVKREVGRVVNVWKGSDDHLWATLVVKTTSDDGMAVLEGIANKSMCGLSIANTVNADVLERDNKVEKINFTEVSFVEVPDDPAARVLSVAHLGAAQDALLRVTEQREKEIREALIPIYMKHGTYVPPEAIAFFMQCPQHIISLHRMSRYAQMQRDLQYPREIPTLEGLMNENRR